MKQANATFRLQISLFQLLICLTGGALTYALARHFPAAFIVLVLGAFAFLALVIMTLLVVLLLTVIEVLMQLPEYLSGGALWISETQPHSKSVIENPYRAPLPKRHS